MAAAVIGLVLTGCATFQPVTPGQFFPGPLVDVHAPATANWQILLSRGDVIAFGRNDESNGKTYIAGVAAFRLPPFTNQDELLSVIKTEAMKDKPAARFSIVQSSFQVTTERAYPCVRFHAEFLDVRARTAQGTASLPLYMRELYCQHPARPSLGLSISYSQRGGPSDPDLEFQANSFIDGVRAQERFVDEKQFP
jgi:hypothetical protein